MRAALFAATPVIVSDYAAGATALALDWYEEIRAAAGAPSGFTPSPLMLVADEDVAAAVAVSTEALYDVQREVARDFQQALEESLALVEAEVQKFVASGFRDTMTGNADVDPDAVGWQRHARPDGCKFCRMLAARGAVFTETSVNFAAHTNCHCVVGPSFDPTAPGASVMQYVASKRQRTERERADLREYLTENFPDAPG